MNPRFTVSPNLALEGRSNFPCFQRPLSKAQYDRLCRLIRGQVIEMSLRAGTPHLASSLSCVELIAAMYGGILSIDPENPNDPARDRFILSKGHAAAALYSALAFFGFFAPEELLTFASNGSDLAEQPSPNCRPGVEAATGSLGHGLSLGLGMSLASRITDIPFKTYVLISDGECNEGSVWEAAMLAPAKKLGSLTVIVDFNKWQATDRSEEVMAISPLKEKFIAFGWDAFEVDGHNIEEILSVLQRAPRGVNETPLAIIAHTIKGKGVSFMEDDNNWHYRIPTEEEYKRAKEELRLE
ncbi:MAG: transketolase [Candidatus Obscuribacterales bacterium]|nr:transketolase [Candidatus Obscuribacterales bacterium]